MLKERTFVSICLCIPLFILVGLLRPSPVAVTVLPLSYNPVLEANPASERFWVMKAQGITRYDMLLMGDSRVYRGLSPQAMQSILPGYRILNYGFSGGGLNTEMYQSAEMRLDPKSSRKIIVLGISPLTLTPRAAANEHFLQEMDRPPDYVFLHLYWMPFLKALEPFHLNGLNNPLVGKPAPQTKEGYYLEFHDDGWVASYTIPEMPDSAIPSYRDIFSTTRVTPQLVQSLLDQTRKWVQQGIHVYAYRPPSSPAMVDLENQMSHFDETAFSKQFEEAGGTWFSISLKPYHSYDGSHLTRQSAVDLSVDLAKLIKEKTK